MCSVQTCVCRWCARSYVADPRNGGRQQFCTRRGCVLDRKRARQRLWYRERYGTDASFREAAKGRVYGHRRRVRQALGQGPPARVAEARLGRLEQALLGLAAQLMGEPGGVQAGEVLQSWADAGRRSAAGMACGP